MWIFAFTHPHVVVVFFSMALVHLIQRRAKNKKSPPSSSLSLAVGPFSKSLSAVCPTASVLTHLTGWSYRTWFYSVNSSSPLFFPWSCNWIRVKGCLASLTWFLSWKPQSRCKWFQCVALCRFGLKVVFEWPSPVDKTKLTYLTYLALKPSSLPHFLSHLTCVPSPVHPSPYISLPLHLTALQTLSAQCLLGTGFCVSLLLICTPVLLCISNFVQTAQIQNHSAAWMLRTHKHTQRRHGGYAVRAVTCPEAEVWTFFFPHVLFWQSNKKPVGISQEFISDIILM